MTVKDAIEILQKFDPDMLLIKSYWSDSDECTGWENQTPVYSIKKQEIVDNFLEKVIIEAVVIE